MKVTEQHLFNKDQSVLRQIRAALELTQGELAEKLGIERESLARWEVGMRQPRFTVAQIKELQTLLHEIGLDFKDLPDDLSKPRDCVSKVI